MNGTTLRIATAVACVAALAAPGSALAAKKHGAHKTKTSVVKKAVAPKVTITLRHDFLAGGNGATRTVRAPGVRGNLGIDFAGLYAALGNQLLAQLGTAPVVPGVPVTLPPLPLN